jgi:hypothetical protein
MRLSIVWFNVLIAASAVSLTGCSDHLEADLAACEARVMGASRSAHELEETTAADLRECMRAEGWPVRDSCLDTPHMWNSPDCYLQ